MELFRVLDHDGEGHPQSELCSHLNAPRTTERGSYWGFLTVCDLPIRRPVSSATSSQRWGILVLSDAPAFPSLVSHLPSLAGRVVSTSGAGQLGHSSFDRSCSTQSGCSLGADPGGAWTRSLVDFYLAGAADGFVKGLFTSFLFATMRRNLLCCQAGAFTQ